MPLFSRTKPPKLLLPHQCSPLVEEKVSSNYDDDYDDYNDYDDYDEYDEIDDAQNDVHQNK